MYPFIRMVKEIIKFRNAPKLGIFDTHRSSHVCWPWDIDLWLELNNGRTLTLFDLGRIPLATRTGMSDLLKRNGWGIAVAGASVRYRKRVRAFQKIEMRSRFIGWDDKFTYMEQSMWRNGECTSHILIRGAITDHGGLVRADRFEKELGWSGPRPALPEWVTAWCEADDMRPWPPMVEQAADKLRAA